MLLDYDRQSDFHKGFFVNELNVDISLSGFRRCCTLISMLSIFILIASFHVMSCSFKTKKDSDNKSKSTYLVNTHCCHYRWPLKIAVAYCIHYPTVHTPFIKCKYAFSCRRATLSHVMYGFKRSKPCECHWLKDMQQIACNQLMHKKSDYLILFTVGRILFMRSISLFNPYITISQQSQGIPNNDQISCATTIYFSKS